MISPCLWFDSEAEEAAAFYVSLFKNSRIKETAPYLVDTPSQKPLGSVMTVTFVLEGQEFMALNGGPFFKKNPSISFVVNCKDPDALWKKLSEGGKVLMPLQKYPFSERYGWVQDTYGVSWQIAVNDTPSIVTSLLFIKSRMAKEAVELYTSVFPHSKVNTMMLYGEKEHEPQGTVKYASFTLNGQAFAAMDGSRGHDFSFSEGISLMIPCSNQKEMDYYYFHLSAVPSAEVCGWLKDKFGVSWQLVPENLDKWMTGPNAKHVMAAVMEMKRLDIEELRKVNEG